MLYWAAQEPPSFFNRRLRFCGSRAGARSVFLYRFMASFFPDALLYGYVEYGYVEYGYVEYGYVECGYVEYPDP